MTATGSSRRAPSGRSETASSRTRTGRKSSSSMRAPPNPRRTSRGNPSRLRCEISIPVSLARSAPLLTRIDVGRENKKRSSSLGMVAMTAWVGLTEAEVGNIKPDNVVVVSGAAGATVSPERREMPIPAGADRNLLFSSGFCRRPDRQEHHWREEGYRYRGWPRQVQVGRIARSRQVPRLQELVVEGRPQRGARGRFHQPLL